jgi:hypothetical protein
MNLVELVKNQLGGDALGQLGNLLGSSPEQTKTAVNAAVPTLLAGLGQLASTPDGARRLNAAVDSADSGVVGNAARALSADGQSMIESGSGVLGSLFGHNMLSSLGGVLSKFSGLGLGSITSLLGAIAPMILGVLKKGKNEMGLDASGLSNLLAGQKQNIANAMPAGLGSMLGSVPGLSSLSNLAGRAGDATAAAGRAVGDAGRTAAAGAGSAAKWVIPVLAVGLLGLLIWWATRDRTVTTPTVRDTTPRSVNETGEAVMASAREAGEKQLAGLREQVGSFFTSGTEAFSKITDPASAEAALPQLRDWVGKLDSIKSGIGTLPADAKTQMTSLFQSSWAKLKPTIDRVMSIPGVSEKIKPVVDELVTKATALANP